MEIKTVNDPRKQADRVIAKSEKKLRKATKKAEKVKRRQRKFEKKAQRKLADMQKALLTEQAANRAMKERISELEADLDAAMRDEDGFIVLQERKEDGNE